MDVMNITYAVVVLGALGAAFGLLLAIAAKVFAVEVDERQEAILEVLPGANCGGCGFAGCSAYAGAVVGAGAATNCCAPGGADVAAQIAEIMGVEAGDVERTVAFVRCSGYTGHTQKQFEYVGIDSCFAAMRLGGGNGPNACANGCLGLADCVKACAFGALEIENGVAKINHEKCVGCMSCAAVCPKNIITKVPYDAEVTVPCNSVARGPVVRRVCDTGCIGCKACEKACEFGAIKVENNLSSIDYSKCTGCGACAAKCPRKLITGAPAKQEAEVA